MPKMAMSLNLRRLLNVAPQGMMLAGALTITATPAILGLASSVATGEFTGHIIYTSAFEVAMIFGFCALLTGLAASIFQKVASI